MAAIVAEGASGQSDVCERSYIDSVQLGQEKTMLFGKLLPREGNFFELFNQHGAHIAEGARAFIRLIENYADVELRDKHAGEVGHSERQADKITAEVNRLLHKTFVTPIDREQIHGLINAMDDILDLLQDASETMSLYDVQAMNDDILRLGDLSVRCCERVQHAVSLLPRISRPEVAAAALKTCEEIDRLESDADRVMRSAMSRLFREEKDVRELIKLRAIYELLESISDRCEDVANLIEGVVLEKLVSGGEISFGVVALLVALAIAFDFMNGFHDAANSIATVVSTGVLKPQQAIVFAAFFNVVAIFVFHLSVAATVGKGIVVPGVVDHHVVFGALVGAIAWNFLTWWRGIPSSSSHALIGGIVGAVIAKAGAGALIGAGIWKTVIFIFLSPVLGFLLGALLMIVVANVLRRASPLKVDNLFRRMQLVSAGLYSLGHGGNDAQKTIGIIWMLLIASGYASAGAAAPPSWVIWCCYLAIGLGTLFGGWRIVKTMGQRITKLKPVGGFCAETGGAVTLFLATALGIPVSTTHTITGAIVGVGSVRRAAAVRWGLAGNIVWAWIFTIPATASVAAVFYGVSFLLFT